MNEKIGELKYNTQNKKMKKHTRQYISLHTKSYYNFLRISSIYT